ncbi:MAG: hypothetical protein JRJ24_21840 [Deltaproteobacteria bacterium]|nr:hypothetical protein [Deltaproteobacteria bacterium]
MKRTVSAFLMMVVLSACASSKSSTNDGSTIGKDVDVETMRPPEAAQVVREFQEAYGIPPVPAPDTPVTSMAQVLEIIRGDRLPEFEEALCIGTTRPGVSHASRLSRSVLRGCPHDSRVDSRRRA